MNFQAEFPMPSTFSFGSERTRKRTMSYPTPSVYSRERVDADAPPTPPKKPSGQRTHETSSSTSTTSHSLSTNVNDESFVTSLDHSSSHATNAHASSLSLANPWGSRTNLGVSNEPRDLDASSARFVRITQDFQKIHEELMAVGQNGIGGVVNGNVYEKWEKGKPGRSEMSDDGKDTTKLGHGAEANVNYTYETNAESSDFEAHLTSSDMVEDDYDDRIVKTIQGTAFPSNSKPSTSHTPTSSTPPSSSTSISQHIIASQMQSTSEPVHSTKLKVKLRRDGREAPTILAERKSLAVGMPKVVYPSSGSSVNTATIVDSSGGGSTPESVNTDGGKWYNVSVHAVQASPRRATFDEMEHPAENGRNGPSRSKIPSVSDMEEMRVSSRPATSPKKQGSSPLGLLRQIGSSQTPLSSALQAHERPPQSAPLSMMSTPIPPFPNSSKTNPPRLGLYIPPTPSPKPAFTPLGRPPSSPLPDIPTGRKETKSLPPFPPDEQEPELEGRAESDTSELQYGAYVWPTPPSGIPPSPRAPIHTLAHLPSSVQTQSPTPLRQQTLSPTHRFDRSSARLSSQPVPQDVDPDLDFSTSDEEVQDISLAVKSYPEPQEAEDNAPSDDWSLETSAYKKRKRQLSNLSTWASVAPVPSLTPVTHPSNDTHLSPQYPNPNSTTLTSVPQKSKAAWSIRNDATSQRTGYADTLAGPGPVDAMFEDVEYALRSILNPAVFKDFVMDPLGRHRFREFMVDQGDASVLDLWVDLSYHSNRVADVKSSARALYDLYIAGRVESKPELSYEATQELLRSLRPYLQLGGVGFETTQQHLLDKMYNNQFQTYMRHKIVQECKVQLGKHNLSESEQAGLGDCFCLTNPRLPDHPIVLVSEGFVGVTGYPKAEVVGRNCRFLQGPGTSSHAVQRIRDGLDTGEGCTELLLNYRRNGEPFYCLLCIIPLRDASGGIAYFIGGQTNVTGIMTNNKNLRFLLGSGPAAFTGEKGRYSGLAQHMSPAMTRHIKGPGLPRREISLHGSISGHSQRRAAGSQPTNNLDFSASDRELDQLRSPTSGRRMLRGVSSVGFLGRLFKKSANGSALQLDTGGSKQILAGAESVLNGSAKPIEDQITAFKELYHQVIVFRKQRREITFVTKQLLTYLGLPQATKRDLYRSALIHADLLAILTGHDKSEGKQIRNEVKRAITRDQSLSIQCGFKFLGKSRFKGDIKSKFGVLHMTPLKDVDNTVVAFVGVFS